LARQEQKRLAELERHVGGVADAVFLAKANLKPFDYEKDGFTGALRRQELRAILRTMPDDAKRLEAMHNRHFRAAALEQPGEVSGLPQSTLAQLKEEEIAAKFPDIVNGHAKASEAIELVRQALKTATRAVEAELIASGTTVSEPAPPSEVKSWA
jgi:hypothetical protein